MNEEYVKKLNERLKSQSYNDGYLSRFLLKTQLANLIDEDYLVWLCGWRTAEKEMNTGIIKLKGDLLTHYLKSFGDSSNEEFSFILEQANKLDEKGKSLYIIKFHGSNVNDENVISEFLEHYPNNKRECISVKSIIPFRMYPFIFLESDIESVKNFENRFCSFILKIINSELLKIENNKISLIITSGKEV